MVFSDPNGPLSSHVRSDESDGQPSGIWGFVAAEYLPSESTASEGKERGPCIS